MEILVTGAAGFIGSNLVDRLLRDGHTVIGVDAFTDFYTPAYKRENVQNALTNPHYSLYETSITDQPVLDRIFRTHNIDAVVNLAARPGVRPSLVDPLATEEANLRGFYTLLETAHLNGINKIVYASSSSVYGKQEKVPFSETDPVMHPISPYAATKVANELIASTYHTIYGMELVGLRFFTVYGERGRPDMAPYIFTKAVMTGQELPLFGDGTMERDFTYVGDIVDGVVRCLERHFEFEVINLGNSQPVQINEFISTIERVSGKQANIVHKPVPLGDVPRTYADPVKAKKLLDWEPHTSLEQGMTKFITWFNEHRRTEI